MKYKYYLETIINGDTYCTEELINKIANKGYEFVSIGKHSVFEHGYVLVFRKPRPDTKGKEGI